MLKKITVVVITYNHENYIKKCMDSILDQKGNFELEILVGNDNSPDKTEEILDIYKDIKEVKIINREQNLGPTKNMLDLYKRAKGDYIAILEGDDYWNDSLKLHKQLDILESNLSYSSCITESNMVDKKDKIIGEKLIKLTVVEGIKQLFIFRGGIPTGTLFFRNYFLNMNKEIEELITSGWMIGDLPLLAFLINKGKIYNLKEKTSSYRYITQEGTSYSAMDNYKKNCELERVVKGINKYLKDTDDKTFLKLYLNRLRLEIIKENKEFFKKDLSKNEKKDFIIYFFLSPVYSIYYSLLKKKIKRRVL